MIKSIQPVLKLSGSADKIFDEIARPNIRHQLTFEFSLEEIGELLGFIVSAELLEKADEQIKSGGSEIPARLLLEFIKAAEVINKPGLAR